MLRHTAAFLFFASFLLAQSNYPAANATQSDLLRAADHAVSTLAANIGTTDTTLVLNTPGKFVPYSVLTLDSELMKACAYDGNLTITICSGGRGFAGTTPASHTGGPPNVGAAVVNAINAIHHNRLADEFIALESHLPHLFGAAFTPSGSNTTLTVGQVAYFKFHYPCTITGYDATAHGGTITFDVRKRASGSGSPTSSDSIVASAPPSLSSGTELTSTAVSTWINTVAPDDYFSIIITGVSGATDASLEISCQ